MSSSNDEMNALKISGKISGLKQEKKSLEDFIKDNKELTEQENSLIQVRINELQDEISALSTLTLPTKTMVFTGSDAKTKSEGLVVLDLIQKYKAEDIIQECTCCENLKRSKKGNIRDQFDDKIIAEAQKITSKTNQAVTILFLGPGKMKDLLIATEKLSNMNIAVNWIIIEPKLFTGEIAKEHIDLIGKILSEVSNGKSKLIGQFDTIGAYQEFLKGSDTKKSHEIKNRIEKLYTEFPKANFMRDPGKDNKTSVLNKTPVTVNYNEIVAVKFAFTNNNPKDLLAPDLIVSIDLADDVEVAPQSINAVLSIVAKQYEKIPTVISAQKDEYRKTVSFSTPIVGLKL